MLSADAKSLMRTIACGMRGLGSPSQIEVGDFNKERR